MTVTDPFTAGVRSLTEPAPGEAALRAAGPLVEVVAPPGGPAWVVTEETLARRVLTDPTISKDTAVAPEGWQGRPEVEPPASAAPSLTTLEGAPHTRLRRAHAPALAARPVAAHGAAIADTARTLLHGAAAPGGVVDLTADFTVRYPLTVILDLVGVPRELADEAAAACRGMLSGEPAEVPRSYGRLAAVCGAALRDGSGGIAASLRERVGDELTDAQVAYVLFGLVFAGQITTEAALGFLLAHALGDDVDLGALDRDGIDAFVAGVLREHPPAPFTLWRFTTAWTTIAGVTLPPRSPILVDVRGVNARARTGPDLTFGTGPHYCVGVHLARLELRTALEVLREDFPHARLAVPFAELRQVDPGGTQGSRLAALPVALHGGAGPRGS